MSAHQLFAEAASAAADSRFHEIVIGVAGSIITGTTSVAAFSVRSLVKKVDQLTKALIDNHRSAMEALQRAQADQMAALQNAQTSQTEALQKAQREQTEAIQAGHATFVETMDSTIRENTHALTAITVQLGLQSRELQRVEQIVAGCPGNHTHHAQEPIPSHPEAAMRKAKA